MTRTQKAVSVEKFLWLDINDVQQVPAVLYNTFKDSGLTDMAYCDIYFYLIMEDLVLNYLVEKKNV